MAALLSSIYPMSQAKQLFGLMVCLSLFAALSIVTAKPLQLKVAVFIDVVGGYRDDVSVNASTLPPAAARTWEVLAATELGIAAVNSQTAILPLHDIQMDIYDCLFNPAEASLLTAEVTTDPAKIPSVIIGPVIDDTASMVSVIGSQNDVSVYLDSSSKLFIGGGVMDMVVTSSSPSAMAQGLAMADLIIHLGFTRCYFLKEAARDVSMNFAYLEGIRRRAVKDNRLEVLDREVTLDELLIARALTDIKMLGIGAIVLVTGTNSETVWFHLVMKTAQNLGMTSGTYGWFANSALLSQPDLSATFGASLEGFVGLRAPWTMNEGDQRTAFQARWQAAYASAPESVYGIPSSLIGERRYNAVWRIARALHDFEELKTYCTDDARNTSVYARIAQYPNSSCTATPTVWPAADTQEQLCCIMARADLGHHVTSQSKQSAAEKQDMWWSRAAVLSRLLWNRSSVDAEGDAGFGWSTKNGMTVNAFQIVNIVKGGAAQVVGMYGLSSSGVGSNQSVQVNASQIVWMGGATMRPADDVMITRRVRENSLGLVAIILLLAGVGFIYAAALLYFNTKWRDHPVVRLSSYKINNVTIIGVCLSLVFTTIYSIRDRATDQGYSDSLCQLELWSLTLGFTLGFGSLFAKTYRVHRLFNSKKLRLKSIHDWFLFSIVGAMILLDLILLGVWQDRDSLRWQPVSEFAKSANGERVRWMQYSCTSTHRSLFMMLLCAEKGCILLYGAYLAFRVRDVAVAELNDSKWIGVSIYNVTALFLLMSPVFFLQNSVDRVVALAVLGLSTLVMAYLVLSLLFLPKIWAVYCSGSDATSLVKGSNQVVPLIKADTANVSRMEGGGSSDWVSVRVKPAHTRQKTFESTTASPSKMLAQPIHPGTRSSRGYLETTSDSFPSYLRPTSSSGQRSPVKDQSRVRELEDLLKRVRDQLRDAREQQRLGRVNTLQNSALNSDSGEAQSSVYAPCAVGFARPQSSRSPVSSHIALRTPSDSSLAVSPLQRFETTSISGRGLSYLAPMQGDRDQEPDYEARVDSQHSAATLPEGTAFALPDDGRNAVLSPLYMDPDSKVSVPHPSAIGQSVASYYPINAV